jgi:DNA-binding CsgD family transcriptional regulator
MSHRTGRALIESDRWETLTRSLHLSSRERDILEALLNGADGEVAVADCLGISVHTVHTHLERLYRKLGVKSRTQLIISLFVAYATIEDPAAPNL